MKRAYPLTINLNHRRFGAAFALCLATLILTLTPQTTHAQNRNPASALPATVPPIMLGRMLVAGQGMAILQLGASFQQVLQDFGPPAKVERSGLLGKIQNWLYRADDGTDIIVTGEDAVDAISLRGPLDSTFMTMEGVGFGTDRGIVLTHYGRPKVSEKGRRLDYPARGITFDLTATGAVRVISIDKIEN